MRIRQQAKLAGVPISNGISSGDHSPATIAFRCSLNQSPWDVVSLQIGGDDSYTPNESFGNSLGSVESVASMKIYGDGNVLNNYYAQKSCLYENASVQGRVLCGKTDGKSWQCEREVEPGQTLCQHHLDRTLASGVKKAGVAKDRRKKRVGPSLDPGYYYYSGFGPCWAKQRGGARAQQENLTEPTLMEIGSGEEQYDYIDDYDNDDDEDNNGAKGKPELARKRGRKRVKAKSLSSL